MVEQSASLTFLAHFWAIIEGHCIGAVLQLGPLGVEHADVDGQGGEAQQDHHEDGDEDADGTALAVSLCAHPA